MSDTKAVETQGEFRARMRNTFGDGRNGTVHWRDNPAAQAEINKRKALKDQAWQAQLATWKTARAEKKAIREVTHAAREIEAILASDLKVAQALQAPNVAEALKILGIKLS